MAQVKPVQCFCECDMAAPPRLWGRRRVDAEGQVSALASRAAPPLSVPPPPSTANHILAPFGERGSFLTLNGKLVTIDRDVLTTGTGFKRSITAKMLALPEKVRGHWYHDAGGRLCHVSPCNAYIFVCVCVWDTEVANLRSLTVLPPTRPSPAGCV